MQDFIQDALIKSQRRNMMWYQNHLMKVLQDAKDNFQRDADITLALGKKLVEKLNEKRELPTEVTLRKVELMETLETMKPIEPEITDLHMMSSETNAIERYLKERYKKLPEDRFYFRACTSWDYGWQQKQSLLLGSTKRRGRCAILRDTFYRKNNVGPDPSHYAQPAGCQISICGNYDCNAN